MTKVNVNRALAEKAIVFLEQYKELLSTSKYPPDEYRVDTLEDIILQLRRACND